MPADSEVYIDWMKEFDDYKKEKDQSDLVAFFDHKIQLNVMENAINIEVEEIDEIDTNYVEYIDPIGAKQ